MNQIKTAIQEICRKNELWKEKHILDYIKQDINDNINGYQIISGSSTYKITCVENREIVGIFTQR